MLLHINDVVCDDKYKSYKNYNGLIGYLGLSENFNSNYCVKSDTHGFVSPVIVIDDTRFIDDLIYDSNADKILRSYTKCAVLRSSINCNTSLRFSSLEEMEKILDSVNTYEEAVLVAPHVFYF